MRGEHEGSGRQRRHGERARGGHVAVADRKGDIDHAGNAVGYEDVPSQRRWLERFDGARGRGECIQSQLVEQLAFLDRFFVTRFKVIGVARLHGILLAGLREIVPRGAVIRPAQRRESWELWTRRVLFGSRLRKTSVAAPRRKWLGGGGMWRGV